MKNKVLRLLVPGLMAVISIGCYGMKVPISQPQPVSVQIEIANQTGYQLNIDEMMQGMRKHTTIGNVEEKRISLLPLMRKKADGTFEKFPERYAVIHSRIGSFKLVFNDYAGSSELIVSKHNSTDPKDRIVVQNPRKPILIFEPNTSMPTVRELE